MLRAKLHYSGPARADIQQQLEREPRGGSKLVPPTSRDNTQQDAWGLVPALGVLLTLDDLHA